MELTELGKDWLLVKDKLSAVILSEEVAKVFMPAWNKLSQTNDLFNASKVWFNIKTKQFLVLTRPAATSDAV